MIADEIWILTAFSVVPQNFLILVSRHGTNQKKSAVARKGTSYS